MRRIYHLVSPSLWNSLGTGPYRAASLETEGFIHCSNADQVAQAANRFYSDCAALLVLYIDAGRLTHEVRDEPAQSGERFPHIYGPIHRDAVVHVQPLQRDGSGRWVFEENAGA